MVDSSYPFPFLTVNHVCEDCVKVNFAGNFLSFYYYFTVTYSVPRLERLYQIEHPQIVAQFDEVNLMEEDSIGYWISKVWLKGRRFEVSSMYLVGTYPNSRLEIGET
jgi:hypothetical protein